MVFTRFPVPVSAHAGFGFIRLRLSRGSGKRLNLRNAEGSEESVFLYFLQSEHVTAVSGKRMLQVAGCTNIEKTKLAATPGRILCSA